MAGIYGVCRHDVMFVHNLCARILKPETISVNEVVDQTELVFITSPRHLSKNARAIMDSTVTVFVFGAPVSYKQYSVSFVDLENTLSRTDIKNFIQSNEVNYIKRRKFNLSDRLLRRAKPSIIKTILTDLYRIQDKDIRNKVKTNLFYAIGKSDTIEGVRDTLISLSVKPNLVDRILGNIEVSIFSRTLSAISDVKTNKLTVAEAAREYKISTYDIRYVLSQTQKIS